MIEENIVRDLYVSNGNRTIKASYFVQSGIIHASIEGRLVMLPVSDDGSEENLRRLVVGQAQMRSWRERIAERWLPRRNDR